MTSIKPYRFVSYHHDGLRWLEDTSSLLQECVGNTFPDFILRRFIDAPATVTAPLCEVYDDRQFFAVFAGEQPLARIAFFRRTSKDHFMSPRNTSPSDQETERLIGHTYDQNIERGFLTGFYVDAQGVEAGLFLLEEAIAAILSYDSSLALITGPVSLNPVFGSGLLTAEGALRVPKTPILFPPVNQATRQAMDAFVKRYPLRASKLFHCKVSESTVWSWHISNGLPRLAEKMAEATFVHPGLTKRKFDVAAPRDYETLVHIYNDAYGDHPYFVPITLPEVHAVLKGFRLIEPRCSTIVELNGEPVAVLLSVSNEFNLDLTSIEDLPKHLIRNLKHQKKVLRILTFAIRRAYRGAAIGSLTALLWHEVTRRAVDAGFHEIVTPPIDVGDFYLIEGAPKLLRLTPMRQVNDYIVRVR